MRVGIDGASFGNRRGFGRFARNAVGRLIELDADTDYTFVVDHDDPARELFPRDAREVVVELSASPATAAGGRSNRRARDIARIARAARAERFDAFLFPSLHTWFPACRAPTVVGLHDAITDEHASLVAARRRDRIYLAAKQRLAVRGAAQLFTVSTASQEALSRRLEIPPDRLPVVPEAPDPVFRDPPAAETVRRARERADLADGDRFFVYVGGISPHKNLETLIDAYAVMCARVADAPLLVVVGALDGDEAYVSSAEAVRSRIRERSISERVRLPGFVPDDELAALYAASVAAANPSLAEGFGLPAVEAAAAGTAVVLSDLPAHRESLGAAALFFEPTDVDTLAAHLELLAADTVARDEIARRCTAAIEGMSWDAAAEALRGLLVRTAALA